MERVRTVDGHVGIGFCEYIVDTEGLGFVIDMHPPSHNRQLVRLQGVLAMLSIGGMRLDVLSGPDQSILIRGAHTPEVFLKHGGAHDLSIRTMSMASQEELETAKSQSAIEFVYAGINHEDERKFRVRSLTESEHENTIYLPVMADVFALRKP